MHHGKNFQVKNIDTCYHTCIYIYTKNTAEICKPYKNTMLPGETDSLRDTACCADWSRVLGRSAGHALGYRSVEDEKILPEDGTTCQWLSCRDREFRNQKNVRKIPLTEKRGWRAVSVCTHAIPKKKRNHAIPADHFVSVASSAVGYRSPHDERNESVGREQAPTAQG